MAAAGARRALIGRCSRHSSPPTVTDSLPPACSAVRLLAFPIGQAVGELAAYWLGCLAGLAADWSSRLPIYAPNGHLPARALFLPSPIPLRPPGWMFVAASLEPIGCRRASIIPIRPAFSLSESLLVSSPLGSLPRAF